MKKSLFLLVLSLMLVGCSSTPTETTTETTGFPKVETIVETTTEAVVESEEETVVETQEETQSESQVETGSTLELGKTVEFGDWEITPTEFKLVKDENGLSGLRVTYTAKNIGVQDNIPSFSLMFRGFQDGVETGYNFFISEDVDLGIGSATLKPGAKLEGIQDVIDIKDLSKPLRVELIQPFETDFTKLETTIEDLSIYQ